jgi:hypothetical protein
LGIWFTGRVFWVYVLVKKVTHSVKIKSLKFMMLGFWCI